MFSFYRDRHVVFHAPQKIIVKKQSLETFKDGTKLVLVLVCTIWICLCLQLTPFILELEVEPDTANKDI